MRTTRVTVLTTWMMLVLFCCPTNLEASRLWGALSNSGFTLNNSGSGLEMGNANFFLLNLYQLPELQAQGQQHPSGRGLVWYTPAGIDTMRENERADQSHPYTLKQYATGAMLGLERPSVTLAMGHVRRASSGCGVTNPEDVILPDPHPWYWSKGFQSAPVTYTFSHNGTLHNKQGLVNLIGYDWLFQNGGLETFGEYAECGGDWTESLDNVIDSQIYFKWLMKNIQENDYDVLAGIHQALSHTQFMNLTSDENLNFLFSDGEAIWAYRRASTNDATNPDFAHTLYRSSSEGVFNLGGASYPVGMKAAMSQPRSNPYEIWHPMDNDELVYLPRSGNVVSYPGFMYLNQVELKPFSKNWNWVGFPLLPNNNATDITDVLGDLAPDALSLKYEQGAQSYQINYNLVSENWPQFDLNSVSGYKVLMSSSRERYNLGLAGNLIDPATTVELHAGNNWVNYFLPETQDIFDALPDEVIQVLSSVKAQDWYKYWNGYKWVTKIYNTTACPIGQGASCTTAQYGSMYEITVNAPASFQWQSGAPQPPPGTRSVELASFTVTQQPDYSPVTLTNIQDPESVEEVGLFLGETCIGATTVSDTDPIDLQAYNGTQNLNDVTVQVVRSNSGLAKGAPGNRMIARQAFKPANISVQRLPNGDRSYTVDLSDAEEIPADFQLHLTAFPNPFNPSTTIRFNLVSAGRVSLTVYDIMGREIETLNAGRLESGNHRFHWDGSSRPSGIYFVRLSTDQKQETRKIILMK